MTVQRSEHSHVISGSGLDHAETHTGVTPLFLQHCIKLKGKI